MKLILLPLLLSISSCKTAHEKRFITDREKMIEKQNRNKQCLTTAKSNDEYIDCVGIKYEDLQEDLK